MPVIVADGHSIIWYGERYCAGETVILPWPYIERLQFIGFIVGPPVASIPSQSDAQPLGMP